MVTNKLLTLKSFITNHINKALINMLRCYKLFNDCLYIDDEIYDREESNYSNYSQEIYIAKSSTNIRRELNYSDISLIAKNKYRYEYENDNTIFDISGSSEQLTKQVNEYLQRPILDQHKTFTNIVNINNAHWVALVILFKHNEYYGYYIDSFGTGIHISVLKVLTVCNIQNIRIFNIKQQNDGYDCGLWALENAYNINRIFSENDSNIFEPIDLPDRDEEYFRQIREEYLFAENEL